MISIIVPIYNAEKQLRRCIDSILNQIYEDYELLLVDDGSTDGSGEICDMYTQKDNRITAFHKKNGGVSSARNIGLDYAKGDWVSFIDSDDYVNNNFLSDFISDVTENDELIVQGFTIIKQNSEQLTVKYIKDTCNISEGLDRLCHQNFPGTIWNKLFRKSIINANAIRFNENYKFKEDELFLLEYLNQIQLIKFKDSFNYQYIEPIWDEKYKLNDVYVLKECYTVVDKHIKEANRFTLLYFFNPYVDAVMDSILSGNLNSKHIEYIHSKIRLYNFEITNRTARTICMFPLPFTKLCVVAINLLRNITQSLNNETLCKKKQIESKQSQVSDEGNGSCPERHSLHGSRSSNTDLAHWF